jgi:hypothetical protein
MRDLSELENKFIKMIFTSRRIPYDPIFRPQLEILSEIGSFSGQQILDISIELERRGLIEMTREPSGAGQRTGGVARIQFTQRGVDYASALMQL